MLVFIFFFFAASPPAYNDAVANTPETRVMFFKKSRRVAIIVIFKFLFDIFLAF
jgi:hypothetical protein